MLQVLNLCETPVTDAGLLALSCEYRRGCQGGCGLPSFLHLFIYQLGTMHCAMCWDIVIQSLNKCLLSICYMSGTILGSGNKTGKIFLAS